MDKKLLEKFRRGDCSPEEIVQIILWYQSEESESVIAKEVEELWGEEDLQFSDKDLLLSQIKNKIAASQSFNRKYSSGRSPVPGKRKVFSGVKVAMTSLVVMVVVAAVAIYFFSNQLFEEQVSLQDVEVIHREISKGQKYTTKLPDGTVVKINSNSSISYPETFSEDRRVIQFEGEAFFDVAKDPSKPFIIQSGDLSTTVLGTSFNLKARKEVTKFEVAVVTGSVQVSYQQSENNQDKRILKPNEQAVYDPDVGIFSIHDFDPNRIMAWANGKIIFDNATLEEITYQLENWYGVKIDASQLQGKISKGYTGEYKDKSLESVLDGVSYVLGFEYEIENKNVTIK